MSLAAHQPALRLAVIRRRYAPFGGAERFIERSLTELHSMGVEPTLVCAEWAGSADDQTPWPVVRLGKPRGLTRARRELAFARDVRGFLAQTPFDLVQSHERIPGLSIFRAGDGLHCEWLRQRQGIQSRAQRCLTALSPYHRFCLEQERQLYGHQDLRAVICNSEMVRDEIAEHFPAALSKVRVVRNGIDANQFQPATPAQRQAARRQLGLPDDKPVMAFVGSGFERKGLACVLEAAHLVPQVHVLIAGQDKHLARYRRRSEQLGLGGRAHFLGGRHDVPLCLDAADGFFFPTLYDPGPNAVLEAMAKGLPVLTSTKCGLAEVVVPAGAGVAHGALDVPAFAQSLGEMMDRARRERMGQAARAAALQLSLRRLAVDLRRLYEELLA